MTDGDSIAHVAVVILLLVLSVPALATAYDYAGTPYEYQETVTVNYTNESSVSETATIEGYRDNEVITSGGSTLDEGTDYQWNTDTGNITWLNTTATSDGGTATIEYAAYQRTPQTELAWTILAPFMGLFGLFGLIVSVRALLTYIGEVWD